MGQWHPDAIERQLAHCDNNAVRRAYARGEFWEERIRMMQHWSDHLDFLRDGAKVMQGAFGKTGCPADENPAETRCFSGRDIGKPTFANRALESLFSRSNGNAA